MSRRLRQHVNRVIALLALFCCGFVAHETAASGQTPGVIVEEIAENSQAAKSGLRLDDRIISYDGKLLSSPAALQAVTQNTFGKKDVILEVQRGAEILRVTVPAGALDAQTRPALSIAVAERYREGRAAVAARQIEQALSSWERAARQAQQEGEKEVAAWLYGLIGQEQEKQEHWEQAGKAYLSAWDLLKDGSDRAAQSRMLSALGRFHDHQSDFSAAEKWFQQAREADLAEGRELWAAGDLSDLGVTSWERGDLAKAEDFHNQALAIRKRLVPDSLDLAANLNNLGLVAWSRGDLLVAKDYFGRALAIRERLAPNSLNLAGDFNNLGTVAFDQGDLAAAEDDYGRAAAICRQVAPDSLDMAGNFNNLGNLKLTRGDLAGAQDDYSRAFAIRERLAPDSLDLAMSLNNLGAVAYDRGDRAAAQDYYRRALALRERLAPNSPDVAASLDSLGNVAHDRGDSAAAEEYYSRALAIRERLAPDSLDLATSLNNLGVIAEARAKLSAAQDYYSRALAIQERLAPDSLDVALNLGNLGSVARGRSDLAAAQHYYDRALAIQERLAPNSKDVSESLTELGKIAFKQRRFSDARSLFARAIDIVESQRARIPSAEERAFLLAKYKASYAGLLRADLALHDSPAAYYTLERARARSLLDLLAEARVDVRQDVDPTLLERERSLQRKLNDQAFRQTRLLEGKHTEEEAAAMAKEINATSAQFHLVESAIRGRSPHYAALTQPQPLTLAQVQRQVLDPESLLLDYFLGDEASYLFVVSPASSKYYRLPKQNVIEAAARHAYDLLTARNRYQPNETAAQRHSRVQQADLEYAKAAAQLCKLILAPAAGELGNKRLLVVADGILLQIPFSALPDPAAGNPQPLLAAHEIVNLASASVLAFQRHELAGRKPASRQLAIFADPVFDAADERMKGKNVPGPLSASAGSLPATKDLHSSIPRLFNLRSGIARLPFSRNEANAIFALASAPQAMRALDFDASKTAATDSGLRRYRIVHFATHALLSNDHPELSGIVLSLVNRKGQAVDGFLRLNEVYNLHLPADLVVLSACQTGLGKQVEGEGLIGLTRGFMYAGAARVVASLWQVDDQATAKLMGRFYDGMLREGKPAAAALRQAQLEMSRDSLWHDAYFWAGFELQGEWKQTPDSLRSVARR